MRSLFGINRSSSSACSTRQCMRKLRKAVYRNVSDFFTTTMHSHLHMRNADACAPDVYRCGTAGKLLLCQCTISLECLQHRRSFTITLPATRNTPAHCALAPCACGHSLRQSESTAHVRQMPTAPDSVDCRGKSPAQPFPLVAAFRSNRRTLFDPFPLSTNWKEAGATNGEILFPHVAYNAERCGKRLNEKCCLNGI